MSEANTTTDNGTTDNGTSMGERRLYRALGIAAGVTAALALVGLVCTTTISVEDEADVASEGVDTTPESA